MITKISPILRLIFVECCFCVLSFFLWVGEENNIKLKINLHGMLSNDVANQHIGSR